MFAIIFSVAIGGWFLFTGHQLSGFWQVGNYILASWFIFASAYNAWHHGKD